MEILLYVKGFLFFLLRSGWRPMVSDGRFEPFLASRLYPASLGSHRVVAARLRARKKSGAASAIGKSKVPESADQPTDVRSINNKISAGL